MSEVSHTQVLADNEQPQPTKQLETNFERFVHHLQGNSIGIVELYPAISRCAATIDTSVRIVGALNRLPSVMPLMAGEDLGRQRDTSFQLRQYVEGLYEIQCRSTYECGVATALIQVQVNRKGRLIRLQRITYCCDYRERELSQELLQEPRLQFEPEAPRATPYEARRPAERQPASQPRAQQPSALKTPNHNPRGPKLGELAARHNGNRPPAIRPELGDLVAERISGQSTPGVPDQLKGQTKKPTARGMTAAFVHMDDLAYIDNERKPVKPLVKAPVEKKPENPFQRHEEAAEAIKRGHAVWFAPIPDEDSGTTVYAGIVYSEHHREGGLAPDVDRELYRWGTRVNAQMWAVAMKLGFKPLGQLHPKERVKLARLELQEVAEPAPAVVLGVDVAAGADQSVVAMPSSDMDYGNNAAVTVCEPVEQDGVAVTAGQ